MLVRIWLAFSVVIAVVLSVLAGMSILQHNATFSDLLGRRVSVIAQTSAAALQPIVDLGLPISMVRNGDEILARAHELDPLIRAAHAINLSGIVVHSTSGPSPQTMPAGVLGAMQLSNDLAWNIETATEIHSGFKVQRGEETVGSVVIAYPRDGLDAASRTVTTATVRSALVVWAILSALAWLALHLMFAKPLRALVHLEADAGGGSAAQHGALLGPAIAALERDLVEATCRFRRAEAALMASGHGDMEDRPAPARAPEAEELDADPTRSLAIRLASRLAPLAALFIIVSALVLGGSTLQQVTRSFEPEFAARTELIGTVVSENIRRAVSAGVPVDQLPGAESYFGDMLERLPEVARIAVLTPDGRAVLAAGHASEGEPGRSPDARSHPIFLDGEQIGSVVIEIDSGFVAKSFRDVFLDMGVVLLVSVLLSFEVMVLLSSRSLTAPLDRLQRIAAMQATGNFSMRAAGGARDAAGELIALLSRRAELLHDRFRTAWQRAGPDGRAVLEEVGRHFGLSSATPAGLRLNYFTDIRLALFLFAAADELPASFLVLYTRSASNPWQWMDTSVLLSLPLAGYLLAAFVASPFARRLTERHGSRPLLMLAMLPVVGSDIGLYWATSVPEIVLWRTITGFGYALVVLACEDYVIDATPRADRDRALGVFSVVFFGGIFAGTALGGVLADRFGQSTVFLVSAALVAASLALIAWLTGGSVSRPATKRTASAISWRAALSNRRLSALLVGIVAPAQVMDQAFVVFLVPLILDGLGVGVADIARCLMLYCLAVVAIGNFPGRLVASGFTPALGAFVGQVLAGSALLLVALDPAPLTMVAALTIAGIGFGLVRWAAVSLAMAIAESELAHLGAASVLGTLRPFERIVSIAGLLVIAAVAGRIGYSGATATVAFTCLAGAAFFLPFALVRPPRSVADRSGEE